MLLGEDDMHVITPVFKSNLLFIRYLPCTILCVGMGIVVCKNNTAIICYFGLVMMQYYYMRNMFLRSIYENSAFELGDNSIKSKKIVPELEIIEIEYKNIEEVKISKGLLQKYFGLGNVTLYAKVPSNDKSEFSGMVLEDISNSENVYQLIRDKLVR